MSTRRQRERRWAFMEEVEKERQKAVETTKGSEEPKKPRKRGTPAKRSEK